MKLLRDKECEEEGGREGTSESNHSKKRVTVRKQQRMGRRNSVAPSRSTPQVHDVRKMS